MKAPDTLGYFVSIHRETLSTLQITKKNYYNLEFLGLKLVPSGTSVD